MATLVPKAVTFDYFMISQKSFNHIHPTYWETSPKNDFLLPYYWYIKYQIRKILTISREHTIFSCILSPISQLKSSLPQTPEYSCLAHWNRNSCNTCWKHSYVNRYLYISMFGKCGFPKMGVAYEQGGIPWGKIIYLIYNTESHIKTHTYINTFIL